MLKRLFASPNRPCFRDLGPWDTLVYDLSGNRLEISLPPQDYEFLEEDNGKRFNLFDSGFYQYEDKPDDLGNPPHLKGYGRNPVWRRNWETFGRPWDFQHLGTLQSAAIICDISRMPCALNCFNPEQMEQLIMHGLYYGSGPGFGCEIKHKKNKSIFRCSNEYKSPVNWKIINIHGVDWVYYESWQYRPAWEEYPLINYGCSFAAWLTTPLFADKYLLLPFSAIGSLPAEPSNLLMQERIAQIIPTIKLTLSPEALKQHTEALAKFPHSRYSSSRQPEAWQYYASYREGDPAKGEDDIVFEGPCSPPPPLF